MKTRKPMRFISCTVSFLKEALEVIWLLRIILVLVALGICIHYEDSLLGLFGVTLPPETEHHNEHMAALFVGGMLSVIGVAAVSGLLRVLELVTPTGKSE